MLESMARIGQTSERIERLLSEMTLAEKVGQMNQYNGFFDATGPAPDNGDTLDKYEHIRSGMVGSMLNVRGVDEVRAMQKLAVENSRLGVPMIFGFDVIHGYKTIGPIPLAESASWDLDVIEHSARVAAIEASAAGLNWTFAPMVDISREARWGRVMEGGGEDPHLGSAIAAARVRGFQGKDLSEPDTIAACAKHFAAYGFAEAGRDYNTVDIGLSTLYNMVLPPFKACVDAGVATFMNAFNVLNGIPATGDPFLQRRILKEEWEFQGFVVSDWGSIGEMLIHGHAEDGAHAATIAANAGSDMDMESYLYAKHLVDLVTAGKVDMEVINDAVRRILLVKEKLGLFDDPYRYCNIDRESDLLYHPDHMDAALDAARKSIVLLKNEGGLLPLPGTGKTIALIGQLASDKNSPLGSWRLESDDHSAISVLEGMKTYTGNELKHVNGVNVFEGETAFVDEVLVNHDDTSGIDEAVALARTSDIVVLVLGEHGFQSGEGRSRAHLGLPGLQQQLLEKIHAVNQNVVLVLMNGRPLAIEWADAHVPAIIEAWHLGTQSGHAIAQVLYGDYNPSGKLPMTFPRNVGQVPIYYNHKNTGRPKSVGTVFWSHYIDTDNTPLYHFGHGLSYTTFAYADLQIKKLSDQVGCAVRVTVVNSGTVAGEEVVQLYIRDRVASVTRPVRELKGFEKVMLEPGQAQIITFLLTEEHLGFYNNQGEFVIEAGTFDVMVGTSSQQGITGHFEI